MHIRPHRRLSVLALVSALALAACDDGDEAAEETAPEPPVVSVAGIATRDIVRTSKFIGTVEPVDDVALIARVEGFLEEVLVKDGSVVTAGDGLFKIEPEKFEAAEARAAAGVAQAEANLALADIELERDTRLLASDTISQSKFDATLANRDAEAAIVQSNQADLEQAQLDVTYTEIHAPFDGRIGKIDYSVGDLVGPSGNALATLIRISPIYVSFSISEREYVDAIKRLGEEAGKQLNPENSPPVRIVLPNGDEFEETGWLAFVDNVVDPKTGSITLRAQFENATGLLVPGTFVNVEVDSKETARELVVPQAAIQRDQRGDFALVVNSEGMVEQRYITTDTQIETDFVVTDGLQEGESVIVEGLQRVRPGVPVRTSQATQPEG